MLKLKINDKKYDSGNKKLLKNKRMESCHLHVPEGTIGKHIKQEKEINRSYLNKRMTKNIK